MSALPAAFYARPVVEVARALVGCVVRHDGCAGAIVETEAYHESEPACHAHVGLTARTHILFGPPGRAYVYRSYGIHALLNAVCEDEGVGAAVLIRALEPLEGLDRMRERRGLERREELCSGPGKLTQALGIELDLNGSDLVGGPITIEPPPADWPPLELIEGPRIGITKAAELPWRFCAAGFRSVSKPLPRPGASLPRPGASLPRPGASSPADASPADASPGDASPGDASPGDASPADASPASPRTRAARTPQRRVR